MRLDKLLANKAYGSRKEVHQLIKDQRVRINGKIATKKDVHVDIESDEITVDDQIVNTKQYYYVKFHKPKGEGLLLLTNDGIWGHCIINGNKHVSKVYYVEFEGELTEEGIQRIKEGIILGDGTHCKPALIDVVSSKSVHITIEEGKYHQVKRMIGAAGGTVTYLKRLTIGHIDLTGIEEIGSVQDLTLVDIEAFKK